MAEFREWKFRAIRKGFIRVRCAIIKLKTYDAEQICKMPIQNLCKKQNSISNSRLFSETVME